MQGTVFEEQARARRTRRRLLAVLLGAPLACVGFVALIVALVFGLFRSSEVYQQALERARRSPQVTRALGEPVEARFWVTGSLNTSGDSGSADLSIPIAGPRGTGRIAVRALREEGVWSFTRLWVTVDGAEAPIDLIEEQ